MSPTTLGSSVNYCGGQEEEEQGPQHTPLSGASAHADGCGEVAAYSDLLCVVTQEAIDSKTDGVWKSCLWQFGQQPGGSDGVKSRAEVFEDRLCVAPLLLSSGHSVLTKLSRQTYGLNMGERKDMMWLLVSISKHFITTEVSACLTERPDSDRWSELCSPWVITYNTGFHLCEDLALRNTCLTQTSSQPTES